MKFKILPMLLALSVLPASTVWADDEIETGQVVISASRIEQAIEDVPANIDVITAEDIQRMGATSIREVLSMQTGLSIGTGLVSIRGMGNNYTLILVDGRKIVGSENGGDGSANLWATIANITDIERIEIIRGAASTMYGSDAMGGVINIITKKSNKESGSVATSYNGTSAFTSFAYDSGRFGDWTLKLDGNITKNLGVATKGISVDSSNGDVSEASTFTAGNLNSNLVIGGALGYYINENHDVLATYNYSRSEAVTSTLSDSSDETSYNGGVASTLYTLYNGAIDFKGNFGDHQYSFTPTLTASNWVTSSKQYTFADIGFNGMDVYPLNDWNLLTAGLEYTYSYLEHSVVASIDADDDGVADPMHKVGAFVQDEILLFNESLIVLPSVRFDYSNYSTAQFTARLGTTYEFMPDQRIKFNIGNAFRTPNLNYYSGAESQSFYLLVDKDGTAYSGSVNKGGTYTTAQTLGYILDYNGNIYTEEDEEYKDALTSFGDSTYTLYTESANGTTGYSTYHTNGQNQGATFGNAELQPETSYTADLRYEGKLGPVNLAVGGYYTVKDNAISTEDTVGLYLVSGTIGTSDASYMAMRYRDNIDGLSYYRGGELELDYSFADYFKASMGYSLANNKDEDGYRLAAYATHTLDASLNFNYPEWATFASIWGKYMIDYQASADSATTDNSVNAYNYWTINASVGKTFADKYTLVASANDLLQSRTWYKESTGTYGQNSSYTTPEYKLTFTAAF